jgi:uncharacterized protein YecE (DUF72 family)
VTSGWYPPGSRDAEGRLRYYARQFPVVEVDSTYYGLPSARNSALWAARTPSGFVFDVKAFSVLTGHPARAAALPADLRPPGVEGGGTVRAGDLPAAVREELWDRFRAALLPLAEAGRLGAVLLQFPPWFAPGDESAAALARWRERAAGVRLSVEFRHAGWLLPDAFARTCDLLRELGMAFVAVDTRQGLATSLPPVTAATSPDLAVLRLHGRSAHWGTGSKEDRFRHAYTAAELRPWLPEIRALADRAESVHVLFNNCCGDAAVRSADVMAGLLAG